MDSNCTFAQQDVQLLSIAPSMTLEPDTGSNSIDKQQEATAYREDIMKYE